MARLDAAGKLFASKGWSLLGIEIATTDATYAWDPFEGATHFERITLFPGQSTAATPGDIACEALIQKLEERRVDVVALPGWRFIIAKAGLAWCKQSRAAAVLMSESSVHDFERQWWKEAVKKWTVRKFGAALVGGSTHADYAQKLGVRRHRIRLGYDAIDNAYFTKGAEAARTTAESLRQKFNLPEKFLMASGRFIEKKNFIRLLQAFSLFRAMKPENAAWSLVLCGDGRCREAIAQERERLALCGAVLLPGFIQYEDLPAYYGLASAFIHPSTIEQWGLVVNEAMASGLPVAVSSRCGCAPDLIVSGQNGYTFDPFNVSAMADTLTTLLSPENRLHALGASALEHIQNWGPERFASGLWETTQIAHAAKKGRR